jgi:outer membrane protein assembly factor BamB
MDGEYEDGRRTLFPLRGDQATLVWSPRTSGDDLITTVDLPTGRTLAVGPAVKVSLASMDLAEIVVSPDGKTAVANFGEGALAWNTQTGAELWRQEADDKDIEPLVITPGGVLYASLDEGETAALDAGTKELLGMVPEEAEAPAAFTSNGYTLVDTSEGLFAFEAGKA